MSGLYSKKHLMKALKDAGLPASKPTFLDYEKKGVLLKPKGMVQYGERAWRFYTPEEIKDNVQRVRNYLRR